MMAPISAHSHERTRAMGAPNKYTSTTFHTANSIPLLQDYLDTPQKEYDEEVRMDEDYWHDGRSTSIFKRSAYTWRSRPKIIFVSICAFVVLFLFASQHKQSTATQYLNDTEMNRIDEWHKLHQIQKGLATFSEQFTTMLWDGRPTIRPPQHGPPDLESWQVQPLRKHYSIQMTPDEVETMAKAHQGFVEQIEGLDMSQTYLAGSRGIVATAGGKYLPTFLVSLRLLRRTGSKLPVEVFLADEREYSDNLCKIILPSLNARCRVLSRFFGESDTANFSISKFQYKVLALIFSSFENVLFLDADNLALRDPETLFTTFPYFEEKGMILWPDYWNATVSPFFYHIQGRPVPPLQPTGTTESGQILVSKRKHAKTLLLAAYYNTYGPDFYYPMLSQGAHGEGDKETFASAAEYFGAPYHRVKTMVKTLGFINKDRGSTFKHLVMIQHDPRGELLAPNERPDPAFLHAHTPKLDPFTIIDSKMLQYKSGERHRIWTTIQDKFTKQKVDWDAVVHPSEGDVCWWGQDPERAAFEEMIQVACKYSETGPADKQDTCKDLQMHYKDLFGASP